MTAKECYHAGQLTEALSATATQIKSRPTDIAARTFFTELLCFAGELTRADAQLDALATQDAKAAVPIALFRQLIRAATSREQFFAEGRLPEFLDKPSEEMQLRLEASIRSREGAAADAAALLAQAEELRVPCALSLNGGKIDDFRDLDDLTSSFLEVLTTNGKYYWIPIDRVELLELHPPEHPRDLLWRPAHLIVRDGPDGEVYLPVLYAGTQRMNDDRLRLGRATEWTGDGSENGPVRGVGQRTFLAGEGAVAILEIKELRSATA